MTEREFNRKRDELRNKIGTYETFEENFKALCDFENFMQTKSHNGYWNPKYAKNRFIKLKNGAIIPFY